MLCRDCVAFCRGLYLTPCLRGRKLNELNIPARRNPGPEALQRFLASFQSYRDENAREESSKHALGPVVKPSAPADPRREVGDASTLPVGDAAEQSPRPGELSAKPTIPEYSTVPQTAANGVVSTAVTLSNGQATNLADGTSTVSGVGEATAPIPPPTVPEVRKPDLLPPASLATEEGQSRNVVQAGPVHGTVAAAEHALEPMDIDEPVIESKEEENVRLLSLPIPAGDHNRPPDALSSPASTTHTVATPHIHEASTDTSPDNEGPQYNEPDDEKTEQGGTPAAHDPSDTEVLDDAPRENMEDAELASSPTQIDTLATVVNDVEAQLLEETAAARLVKTTERSASAEAPFATMAGLESTLLPPSEPVAQPEVLDKASALQEEAKPVDNAVTQQGTGPTDSVPDVGEVPVSFEAPVPAPEEALLDQPSAPGPPRDQEPPVKTPTIEVSPPSRDSSVSERAVTRISSGVLRQKSVSEIIGDSPKATAPITPTTPGALESPISSDNKDAPMPQAATTSQIKYLAEKSKEKRRKSIPTVVFGKPTKQTKPADETALVSSRQKDSAASEDDYFTPLFVESFTKQTSWMKPVEQLLNQAHKTLSTTDQFVPLLDNQACRVLRRVYDLQQNRKWSLRQPVRCPEPTRPPSHQDVLLQEMKWMRTDFREERKWKRAVARNLADACAEWVASGPEERKALQVDVVLPPASSAEPLMLDQAAEPGEEPMPDLIHSDSPSGNDEDEGMEDEPVIETVAPSAIFALTDDDVVFSLRPSHIAEQLLSELPLYGSLLKVPKFDFTGPEFDPDAHWKRPALPLSKYVEGKMVLASEPPPRKRSRYSYKSEEEDDEDVVFGAQPHSSTPLQPVDANVALFNTEMKPVRDRLHAGHQFRPPTEYAMPLQNFYESRLASQWTYAEDDELKALVREYSYNWSLISSVISTKSVFTSAIERRTPWECFERWVHLEGLPNDMSKTQYFKTYHNRIESAQRVIQQQNQNAQQQVAANGAVTPVPRKRPTITVHVERRRNQKHLALIDAMRKLAKKREAKVQKDQHSAAMAANRKQNEGPRPVETSRTPCDYSLMRWKRDQELAEKMALYAAKQHDIAMQRRVSSRRPSFVLLVVSGTNAHHSNSLRGRRARLTSCQTMVQHKWRKTPRWGRSTRKQGSASLASSPFLAKPGHGWQCRQLRTPWRLFKLRWAVV